MLISRALGNDQTGIGNDLANKITTLPNGTTKATASNSLQGLGGNDTLDGGAQDDTLIGGSGADLMLGGSGADLYVVDDAGDKIAESGVDRDTVISFISYTLASKLENLQLVSPFAINGTGNFAGNEMTGGDGKIICWPRRQRHAKRRRPG
jgi:Ca2+-binding RTX toxin-like protein